MKKYYYLPKEYELTIKPYVDYWNENPDTLQSIVTGWYIETNEILPDADTTIQRKSVNGELTTIKRNFKFDTTQYKLTGFVVEGDLESQLNPVVYNELLSLSGVESFETAEACLEFLRQL